MQMNLRARRLFGAALAVVGGLVLTPDAGAAVKGELSFSERTPEYDLGGVLGVAYSPDGENAYAFGTDRIAAFGVDPASGEFDFLEMERDAVDDTTDSGAAPAINGLNDIAVSPDGEFIYLSVGFLDKGVAIYMRDPVDGTISFRGLTTSTDLNSTPNGIAISPDGATVYVSTLGGRLVSLSRDAVTGTLTQIDVRTDGSGPVDGLDGAKGLTVSPDGEAIYVAGRSDDMLSVFSRNTTTGAPTFVEVQEDGVTIGSGGTVDGLFLPEDVVVSNDGDDVYAVSNSNNSVVWFQRDESTQRLDFQATLSGGGPSIFTDNANSTRALYVPTGNTGVKVYDREVSTGALTEVETELDGVNDPTDAGGTVSGLDGARAGAMAPDNAFVMIGGSREAGPAEFSRIVPTPALSFERSDPAFRLNRVGDVAITPDGAHVLVTSINGNSLRSMRRDPTTGSLTVEDEEFDGVDDPSDFAPAARGLHEAGEVTVSPDGKFVYVTDHSDYSVSTYALGPVTGELSFVEYEADGENDLSDSGGTVEGLYEPHDVIVSPDGASVYAPGNSADAVAAFQRNSVTGRLSFAEAEFDGSNDPTDPGGTVSGLHVASDLAISPDGKTVYVAGYESIAVFARDAATSKLSYLEAEFDGVNDPTDGGGVVDGLTGSEAVVSSADGKFVYTAGAAGITTFARDVSTGKLSYLENEKDGINDPTDPGGPPEGIDGVGDLAISIDGGELYSGTRDDAGAIATFERDATTGRLSFLEVERAGVDDPTDAGTAPGGLADAQGMVVSSDQRHLYVGSYVDRSIAIFDREDDFIAPTTTITGGPGEGKTTKDSTPSFTFSSNESPVTFECSVDGGGFETCPASLKKLDDGDHDLEARAVDSENNKDASPATRGFTVDTKVKGDKISAKKPQKIKGSKLKIELKLKAKESATGLGKGKIKVGKKSYKLKELEKNLKSGKKKTLKLKTKKNKDAKKVVKALKKKGKKAKTVKAKLTGKITDDAGNKVSEKLTVKLKKK